MTPHAVLLEHQRLNIGTCACGWGSKAEQWGRSHSQHVLDELRAAGFAIVRDFTVAATVEPPPPAAGDVQVPPPLTPDLCGDLQGTNLAVCEQAKGHRGPHQGTRGPGARALYQWANPPG